MQTQTKKHDSNCLVAYGIDTFGDRWSFLVLRDMMLYGKCRYGDFLASEEQIATNILAARLKHLESEGIISKARDPENRRSYIYSLTEKGLDLAPVLLEIIRWSSRYMKMTARRRRLLERIEADRDGILADIRARRAILTAP
ncbi:MAG: transcriptional regulator [Rhodospirillaceae bacterium]|nr:transcriptional regulator [Magnetovibrio sp.]MAY66262.1 transcriptional regulator [Rhodospirillaceae bacterium]